MAGLGPPPPNSYFAGPSPQYSFLQGYQGTPAYYGNLSLNAPPYGTYESLSQRPPLSGNFPLSAGNLPLRGGTPEPVPQVPAYLPIGGGSASPYGTAAGLFTGASTGAATGAMLGMAGGPLAALTVPGGALLGAGIGALGAGLSGYAQSKAEKKSRALQRELLEKQLAVQKDQIETAKKQRKDRIENAAIVARAMMAAR